MVPPNDRRADREIEDQLRIRVEEALVEFKRANAERDRLFAIDRDVNTGTDGIVAVQQAMRLQRQAVLRLREALRDFEAFNTLNLPPPLEPPQY